MTASQRNYRNHIEANLQNRAVVIVRNMSIQSSIYREGSGTPIYTYDAYELRMAPNSNFNFGIPAGNQPIEAGNYVLKTQVTADEKEYRFEQSFFHYECRCPAIKSKCGQSRADDILHVIWDICRNWRDPRSLVMWWTRRRTRRKEKKTTHDIKKRTGLSESSSKLKEHKMLNRNEMNEQDLVKL